jgi:hypothetical protein
MSRAFDYAMSDHAKAKRPETVDELRARTVRWLKEKGGALLDRLDMSVEDAADLVMQCALSGTSEKRQHEASMDSTSNILKNLRDMGEASFTRVIQKHADSVKLPGETSAMAFNRVFTSPDAQGRAIRNAWLISKGTVAADDGDGVADAVADDDDREDGGPSSLELLQRLADKLRAQHPEWSREKCFTAVYTDPQFAHLAKRERAQSMRKLMR